MNTDRAGLLVLAIALGACRAQPPGQAPAFATATTIFGPVMGAEVIGGRADAGEEILLLAGGTDLVRLSLATRRFARVKLQMPPGEDCWNLAQLPEGGLWTLKGRRTLAQIKDGAIAREVPLLEPHFGLFAVGNRLLFQRADFTPPAPALLSGTPEDASRTPWSAIRTRVYPSLARASVAALNMVTCGPSDAGERACWFPDEAAVSMVRDDGSTRRVLLSGLETVSPEVLLTSDNPQRPVRDAYVDTGGGIWILSSGPRPPGAADGPGGWLLARYRSDGAVEGLVRLSEAARLILRVDARNVMLLMSSGVIGRVPRW